MFAVELEVGHGVAFSWLFISDGEGGRRKGSVSDAEFETIQRSRLTYAPEKQTRFRFLIFNRAFSAFSEGSLQG